MGRPDEDEMRCNIEMILTTSTVLLQYRGLSNRVAGFKQVLDDSSLYVQLSILAEVIR